MAPATPAYTNGITCVLFLINTASTTANTTTPTAMPMPKVAACESDSAILPRNAYTPNARNADMSTFKTVPQRFFFSDASTFLMPMYTK